MRTDKNIDVAERNKTKVKNRNDTKRNQKKRMTENSNDIAERNERVDTKQNETKQMTDKNIDIEERNETNETNETERYKIEWNGTDDDGQTLISPNESKRYKAELNETNDDGQ